MLDNYQHIARLISAYNKNELTDAEKKELDAWIDADPQHKNLFQELTDPLQLRKYLQKVEQFDEKGAWEKILQSHQFTATVRNIFWKRIAVAASIVGLLFVAGYFLVRSRESGVGSRESVVVSHDVKAPQTNRAMVTLSDGRKVFLDSVGSGQLAVQGGVQLMKLADGKIEYSSELKVKSSELGVSSRESSDVNRQTAYNTLTNPRGSKVIDMILADGSHVWLNAGSSITYPVAFIGDERKVSMTGEAYFEVAKKESGVRSRESGVGSQESNKSNGSGERIPFIVEANGVTVQVLGTHFNVNAYNDEDAIRVTLLEGSVRVMLGVRSQESVVIKPGEQAYSVSNGQLAVNRNVDMEQVMAWKNGLFKFDKTDLKEIMRQIARWYDLQVTYEPGVKEQPYNGTVSRNANVSEVLKVLQYTGAKFKVDGKKIIVLK